MCDYSLGGIKNRLAKRGEQLVIHRFSTGSKGLTSLEYLSKSPGPVQRFLQVSGCALKECAVCIPDGAKLRIENVPEFFQRAHGLSPVEVVTFRQLSVEATYRDAFQFKIGRPVLLQALDDGLRVTVLSLSSEEKLSPSEAPVAVRG